MKDNLPTKQFELRESLLIQLCKENPTIRALYNIFLASYILFITSNTLNEYFYNHRIPKGINLLCSTFGKVHLAGVIWVSCVIVTFLTYFCFILWAKIRYQVPYKKLWDKFWILSLILYYIITFYVITVVSCAWNLPGGTTAVIVTEAVRLLMKTHSFVRENISKVIWQPKEKKTPLNTNFFKFLYFLCVPTIVYRDEYPRTKTIRWGFLFARAMEAVGSILFVGYWFEYISFPVFKDVCLKPLTFLDLFLLICQFSISGYLIFLVVFVLFHSSQNAFGELFKFGDRLFYSDWWTTTGAHKFYNKWNWVIKDWLYTYVYKDIYLFVFPKNKILAAAITILVSAIVHEWAFTVSMGFFIPFQLTAMIFSILVYPISFNETSRVAHLFYSIQHLLGMGIFMTFISLEYFARKNIAGNHNFVPLIWKKSCIQW